MNIKEAKAFLNKGGERTVSIKKNIIGTFVVKGLGVLISLLYVPITLNYLNPTRYGIWMTLTSIVAWMAVFDVGLGNGMRNKLAEALAVEDKSRARKYVSTTYAMLSLIIFVILLLFYITNHWINWDIVLNTGSSYVKELNELIIVVVTLFGIKFILNTITIVASADQKPALGSLFEVIGSAIGLLTIWILTLCHKTSLLAFGWTTMLAPVIVFFITSLFFYNSRYSYLKPSFKSIDFTYAKDLTGLGVKFFFIQISGLIITQTGNILIAQFFSPADVTPYNIIFKYFSVLTMVWATIMMPLWSAFTQANAVNDIEWMKKTILKLNKFVALIVLILFLMGLSAQYIINIWTSGKVQVSTQMIWIFALYTLITIWNTLYSVFLNGISVIKIQMYTSILAALLNIPLAFLFVKYFHMGSEGVVLSMVISFSFFAFVGPIQTYKILKTR
jgi:O-antigen/teichoic acid export membrane protein